MSTAIVKWMDTNKDSVAQHLPDGWTHAQARRSAMALVLADQKSGGKLARCKPESVVLACLQAAANGLSFGSHDAYVIPYGDMAEFRLGFRGMIKLAKASGEIRHLVADVVHEGESLVMRRSADPTQRGIAHELGATRTGPIVGAYVIVDRADGIPDFEYVDRAGLDAIRSKAAAGSMGWRDFFGEMAKKAVIRRCLKRYTLQPEVAAIFERDERLEYVSAVRIDTAPAVSPIAALLESSRTAPSAAEPPDEPPARLDPVDDVPPTSDDGAGGSEGVSAVRSVAQLLKGSDGPVDKFKAAFGELDEPGQDEWITALREATADERGVMIARFIDSRGGK